MASKNYSIPGSSRKEREKRRKIRKEAKAKGEYISLDESRRRAGVELDQIKTEKQTPQIEKVEKPTIQLNKPQEEEKQKDKQGLQAPDEEGVIDLTEQGQREETLAEKLGPVGIVGAGVALGTGAYLAGGLVAGEIARRATQKAIQSGFVQQAAQVGKTQAVNAVTKGFATNAKTIGLTSSFIAKAGMTLAAASALIGIIGSYPFAGFIKEEALQTLSFGTKVAMDSGDLEGAQNTINEVNEILNPQAWDKIIGAIPFANVVKNLREFYKAAALKNANDQEALDKAKRVSEGEEESDFAKSRRVSDEAARERDLAAREEDTTFYEKQEEEKKAEDLAEMQWKSEYYALIREGKFEEAEELLTEQG